MPVFREKIPALVALFLVLALPCRLDAGTTREIGVVAVDGLNLRSGPGLGYSVISVLPRDTQVRILGEDGRWLKVFVREDIGYVYNSDRYLKRYVIHVVTKGGDTADLELARARAKELERKLKEKKKKIARLARKAESVMSELEQIDKRAAELRKKQKEIEGFIRKKEAEISRLKQEAEKTREQIEAARPYAEKRLVALYKLAMLGEMNLLASAGSMQEVFRRMVAIETIVSRDEQVIRRLMDHRDRLQRIMASVKKKALEKKALAREYARNLDELEKKRSRREVLLSRIRNEKAQHLSAVKYLKKAAARLDKTIGSLSAASGRGGRRSFAAFRGLLKPPVKGKLIERFGRMKDPVTGAVRFQNGIRIRAQRGTPVRAVFSGKAIYADWLQGYGRVVILSHAGGYCTVYAHLEDMFVRKGESVETGQVIATVGDTASLVGPHLYFEIRFSGKPVDPASWLVKG